MYIFKEIIFISLFLEFTVFHNVTQLMRKLYNEISKCGLDSPTRHFLRKKNPNK